jgi:hypothetical protein
MEEISKSKPIPYGVYNFASLREGNCYYVDKTRYIEEIESSSRYFFFIRPRRFGKSLLLSMLQSYYDILQADSFSQLFRGLYIGDHPTSSHNIYMVLSLSFSSIHAGLGDYKTAMDEYCAIAFNDFCLNYSSLLPAGTKDELQSYTGAINQLICLVKACSRAGRKIYLFIDEYDHFTNDILSSEDRLRDYEEETHREGYLRAFFNAVKEGVGKSIERCFITGVSPVTMDDLTSGFNIGTNYSTHPRFNAMVGFTEEEVRELLTYYASIQTFHHSVDELIEIMRPWYDGYCFAIGKYGNESMYNSNMVLYFVREYIENNGECPQKMIDSNIRLDYEKLRMLIRKDKEFAHDASTIQTIVEQGYILGSINDSFPARAITRPDNFVSLLFYFGMLTHAGSYRGETRLTIPNQVVREQIYAYLLDMYNEIHLKQDQGTRTKLESALAFDGDWKSYFGYIAECLHLYASQRDKQKGEPFVHGFTLAMTSSNRFYRAISEADTQGGYADIFLRPELNLTPEIAHSYLVEFKYIKAKDSVSQIGLRRQEAISQLHRYAQSETIQSALGHTRLHQLLIVYHGMEMVICEEID